MPSTESRMPALAPETRRVLLRVAEQSIRYGLERRAPLAVDAGQFGPELRAHRASFVTLHRGGQLRGCIGHLQAFEPLIADVAENAFSAAFRDRRFPPLTAPEMEGLHIEISVLTPETPLSFASEQELIAQLDPGLDGLILRDGPLQGTFLPSVWESLPEPALFLAHLKAKAGLPADYWSTSLRVSRYRTESFSRVLRAEPARVDSAPGPA